MNCVVDKEALSLANSVASALEGLCTAAVVFVQSVCPKEDHGSHVTCARGFPVEGYTPRQARHIVKSLRQIANEVEAKFCPPGSEN